MILKSSEVLEKYSLYLQDYSKNTQKSKKLINTLFLFVILTTLSISIVFLLQSLNRFYFTTYLDHEKRAYLSMAVASFFIVFCIVFAIVMHQQSNFNNDLENKLQRLETQKSLLELNLSPTIEDDLKRQISSNNFLKEELLELSNILEDRNQKIISSFSNIAQCTVDDIPTFIPGFVDLTANYTNLDLQKKTENYISNTNKINSLQNTIKTLFTSRDQLEEQLMFIYDVYNSVGFLGTPGSSIVQFTSYFKEQSPQVFIDQIEKIRNTVNEIQTGDEDYYIKITKILAVLSKYNATVNSLEKVNAIVLENNKNPETIQTILGAVGCNDLTELSAFMSSLFKSIQNIGMDLSSEAISQRMNQNTPARNFIYQTFLSRNMSVQQISDKLNLELPNINRVFSQIKNDGNLSDNLNTLLSKLRNIQDQNSVKDILSAAGYTSVNTDSINQYGSFLSNLKNLTSSNCLSDILNYFDTLYSNYEIYLRSINRWIFILSDSQLSNFQRYDPSINSLSTMQEWLTREETNNTPNISAYNDYINSICELYNTSINSFFSIIKENIFKENDYDYKLISSNLTKKIQDLTSFKEQYNISSTPLSALQDICNYINSQLQYVSTGKFSINQQPILTALDQKINRYNNFLKDFPIFNSQLTVNLRFQTSDEVTNFLNSLQGAWNIVNNGDKSFSNFTSYLPQMFSSKNSLLTALKLPLDATWSTLQPIADNIIQYCRWINDDSSSVQKHLASAITKLRNLKSLIYAAGYTSLTNALNNNDKTLLLGKLDQFSELIKALSTILEISTRSNGMQIIQQAIYNQQSAGNNVIPFNINKDFQLDDSERNPMLKKFSENSSFVTSNSYLYRLVASDFLSELFLDTPHSYLSSHINMNSFKLSYYLQNSQYMKKLFGQCDNNLSFEILSEINNLLDYSCLMAFYNSNSEIFEIEDEKNPLLIALNTLQEIHYPSKYDLFPNKYGILFDPLQPIYSIFNKSDSFDFSYYQNQIYDAKVLYDSSSDSLIGQFISKKYNISISNIESLSLFSNLSPVNQQKVLLLLFGR